MFKKYLTIILLISFVLFLFVPIMTNAALVPCAISGNNTPCTLCHLIIGIQNIINFGLKIVTFVAITALVFAGILYIISAGNESLMETAKGLIKNILIGFALVLGAFLIVNVTMWILSTNSNLGIDKAGSWWQFQCSTSSTSQSQSSGGGGW